MPFLKGRAVLESRVRNLENSAKKNGLRHALFTVPKDKYVGDWKNDIKEGNGFLLTRSGELYEGSWERGYRHGFGTLAHRNDPAVNVFWLGSRGDWFNGRMHGFLVKHYRDGSYYKGNWKHGKRSGHGQMWYADGSFYEGDWLKDLRHGQGMYVRKDGNRYEGAWSHDKKHGKGRFLHLDSGQLQEGVWINDVCAYSTIEDISFRQTVLEPTATPIVTVKLKETKEVCSAGEFDALRERTSCNSLASYS